jgi:hypothetical protein
MPWALGNSHAIALTWATSSGGKTTRATRARSILKPVKPLLVEATSPPPDHVGIHVQAPCDLRVRRTLRRIEDELGALHPLVSERVARRPMLELCALFVTQDDLIRAALRHRQTDSTRST